MIYTAGALVGAGVTFVPLAAIPQTSAATTLTSVTLILGAIWVWAWASTDGRLRVSLRQRQIRRSTARGRYRGPAFFGFLVGLGWWTVVVTPLFWIGLAGSVLSGHAILGGLIFGMGKSAAAWFGALRGSAGDASALASLLVLRAGSFLVRMSFVLAFAIAIVGMINLTTSL